LVLRRYIYLSIYLSIPPLPVKKRKDEKDQGESEQKKARVEPSAGGTGG